MTKPTEAEIEAAVKVLKDEHYVLATFQTLARKVLEAAAEVREEDAELVEAIRERQRKYNKKIRVNLEDL